MSVPLKIGTTKGPGEKPFEFLFITPDPQGACKTNEFVQYVPPEDPLQRPVLARITARRAVRLYPDEFMADPHVPPAEVAALIGFDDPECELFEVTASILGYFDQQVGGFVNPRIPPRVGWPIYLTPSDVLACVLSRMRPDERGAIHLGWLLSRPAGDVPVVLSARDFTCTHLAIIASTGSGKSYAAGVIVEELLMPKNRGCVLIVDPHGEYDTLAEIANHPAFQDSDYHPKAKVLRAEDVKVRFSALGLGDVRYLMGDLSDRMDWLLGRAHRSVRQRARERGGEEKWSQDDLIRALFEEEAKMDGEAKEGKGTAGALQWRIERLWDSSRIFSDTNHINIASLFRPGQVTVLQLDDLTQREQQVIVSVLLQRLYRARNDTVHNRVSSQDELYLPYPAFVLLEEAHHFAPGGEGGSQVVSAQVLKQILAEGRKFGIGVGLISQRPGKLDQDVLSQAMTQVVLRIVNPIDQTSVAAAVETASREVLDELPALSKGQAIALGASLNAPAMVQVRQRLTRHGGEDLDAPLEWAAWYSSESQRERRREVAPLAHTRRRGVFDTDDEPAEDYPGQAG
jgi:DNA helicase HerA-like ATPase